MKSFACGSVIPGCDARFVAESEADLFAQIKVHAAESHGISEVDEGTVTAIRQHIVAA